MGPIKYDYNKRLITLTVITWRGFHCNEIRVNVISRLLLPYLIIWSIAIKLFTLCLLPTFSFAFSSKVLRCIWSLLVLSFQLPRYWLTGVLPFLETVQTCQPQSGCFLCKCTQRSSANLCDQFEQFWRFHFSPVLFASKARQRPKWICELWFRPCCHLQRLLHQWIHACVSKGCSRPLDSWKRQ